MVHITGLAHVGIRVTDFNQSINFYQMLGFNVIRDDQHEHVMVVKHPDGFEINLLDSANHHNDGRNVLMDESVQYAGITHIALSVDNIEQTENSLRYQGIEITEGPVQFGDGSTSIFFRDPDRNVIELTEPKAKLKAPTMTAEQLNKDIN